MRWSGWGTRWERPGDGRLAGTSQTHEQRPPGNVPPLALFILDMGASAQPARRYYVVSCGTGWEVVADHNYLGRYSSQADAIRQAIDWAQLDGESGHTAQVLVDAGIEGFKVAWAYGRDTYPPKR
jgi:hypothetical protein